MAADSSHKLSVDTFDAHLFFFNRRFIGSLRLANDTTIDSLEPIK